MTQPQSITLGTPIDRAEISSADSALGKGGQGSVYPTDFVAGTRRVVYKEYKERIRPTVDVDVLSRMIATLATASTADQASLLSRCAWPIALVSDGPAAVGFLMPQVPPKFSVQLQGARGDRKPVLAQFQHLLNSPAFLSNKGIRLSHADQFRLLGDVADALDSFHRRDVCVGDLSPMNLLFSLHDDTPAIYFIDCDAMVVGGASVAPQAETPSWAVPTGETLGTPQSDAYKFGLLALRLLAGDQSTHDPERLPAFADTVRPLVERSLSTKTTDRPRPSDWIPSLTLAARKASPAPIGADTDLTDVATTRLNPQADVPQVSSSPPAKKRSGAPTPESRLGGTLANRAAVAQPPEPTTRKTPATSRSTHEPVTDSTDRSDDLRASVSETSPVRVAEPVPARSTPAALKVIAALILVGTVVAIVIATTSNKSDDKAATSPPSYTPYVADIPTYDKPTPTPEYRRTDTPTAELEPYTPPEVTPEDTPTPTPTPTTDPMPGPPNITSSPGFSWYLHGPYQSLWTCGQTQDRWPIASSVCFMHDGSAYFWGLGQD